MPRLLQTHLLPELFEPSVLAGGVAVVIDILRASTTMTSALAHGARAVRPCLQVEEALAERDHYPDGTVLLGGERGGLLIPGFDLGNSPNDYTPDRVAHKTVLFTTTNGTKALHRCTAAAEILIGCFLNLSAVADWLADETRPIHLVCAGTNGQVTLEDCLFAGALATRLMTPPEVQNAEIQHAAQHTATDWGTNDSTRICQTLSDRWGGEVSLIAAGLAHSQGGRNLQALQLGDDVRTCAQLDRYAMVPVWNQHTAQIDIGSKKSD